MSPAEETVRVRLDQRGEGGAKAVQEACAAKSHYHADKAMVVITGRFTPQAIDLARENGVELWGRQRLADEMAATNAPTPASPPATPPASP